MSFSERFADIATSQLGVKEVAGNKGLPFERYGIRGEDPLPWCARFVRWCLEMAGYKIPWNRYEMASVAYLEKQFIDRGWVVTEPARGDIVFFKSRGKSDRGPGRHIGIVVKVWDTGFQTVEGNLGDKVAKMSYKHSTKNVSCFGRIPQKETA